MNIYIFVLFSAFTLLACGQNQHTSKKEIADFSLYKEIEIRGQAISIPLNGAKSAGFFYSYQSFNDTLFCFDKVSKDIKLYDLVALVPLPFINLQHLVADGVPSDIVNVYITNQDSIWVLQEYRISLINNHGAILKSWPINSDKDSINALYGQWDANFNFYCDSKLGACYFQRYPHACAQSFSLCPDYSIEAKLDLRTGEIDSLPIQFSDAYRDTNYGQLTQISRCRVGSKHYYSFESDPNIYSLDLETNAVESYNCKSKHHSSKDTIFKNYEVSLEDDEVIGLYLKGPQYIGLWFEPEQQLFFRFFRQEQSLEKSDGSPNGLWDKQTYLMVLNEQMQLLGEVPLSSHFAPFATTTTSGLIVSKNSPKNPEYNKTALLFEQIKVER